LPGSLSHGDAAVPLPPTSRFESAAQPITRIMNRYLDGRCFCTALRQRRETVRMEEAPNSDMALNSVVGQGMQGNPRQQRTLGRHRALSNLNGPTSPDGTDDRPQRPWLHLLLVSSISVRYRGKAGARPLVESVRQTAKGIGSDRWARRLHDPMSIGRAVGNQRSLQGGCSPRLV